MKCDVTYKHKKQLEKDISNLTSNEYNEILNIIRNNKQKYSENIGGIYFNLKYINDNTIHKIIEFVRFAKVNKDLMDSKQKSEDDRTKINNRIVTTINKNIGKKYTLDKSSIQEELCRLKNKTKENFSFQNFLDKLSVSNIKTFKKNDKIVYPELKEIKTVYSGPSERLLKKCREVNKRDFYSYFSYNENDNEYTDNLSTSSTTCNNTYDQSLKDILELKF